MNSSLVSFSAIFVYFCLVADVADCCYTVTKSVVVNVWPKKRPRPRSPPQTPEIEGEPGVKLPILNAKQVMIKGESIQKLVL